MKESLNVVVGVVPYLHLASPDPHCHEVLNGVYRRRTWITARMTETGGAKLNSNRNSSDDLVPTTRGQDEGPGVDYLAYIPSSCRVTTKIVKDNKKQ